MNEEIKEILEQIQKYLDKKHIAEKYQRKYGEIDG